jgi:hypothetical protein
MKNDRLPAQGDHIISKRNSDGPHGNTGIVRWPSKWIELLDSTEESMGLLL